MLFEYLGGLRSLAARVGGMFEQHVFGIRATCSNGHCVDQLRQDEHAYYASTTRGYHIPFRTERLCSHCEESINLVPVERNDR